MDSKMVLSSHEEVAESPWQEDKRPCNFKASTGSTDLGGAECQANPRMWCFEAIKSTGADCAALCETLEGLTAARADKGACS